MAFADGWICQACWKPNRADHTRCYRCKTEREVDPKTAEARRAELQVQAARYEAKVQRVPGLVSKLPAIVFLWYGRVQVFGGLLVLFVVPIVMIRPNQPAFVVPLLLGFALTTIAVGAGMRWASSGMRESNSWAFALAFVLSIGFAAMALYVLNSFGITGGPGYWQRIITIGLFGLSAILALVGLLYSLQRDEPPA